MPTPRGSNKGSSPATTSLIFKPFEFQLALVVGPGIMDLAIRDRDNAELGIVNAPAWLAEKSRAPTRATVRFMLQGSLVI